jgi:hypothetical protein
MPYFEALDPGFRRSCSGLMHQLDLRSRARHLFSRAEHLRPTLLFTPASLLQPQPDHILYVGRPGAEDLGQDLLGCLQLLAPGVYDRTWLPGPLSAPPGPPHEKASQVVWLASRSEMLLRCLSPSPCIS